MFIFVLGACLGSFVVALVWRMRANQLKCKAKLSSAEQAEYSKLKRLVGRKASSDRSVCLNCGKQLKWSELVPVVSWLALRGKCSKCKRPIGKLEFFTELLLGLAFLGAYLFLQPFGGDCLGVVAFAVWLVFLTALAALFIYDLKWSLMPSRLLYFSVFCAMILLICNILQGSFGVAQISSMIGALAILPGLYLILAVVSRERWVGSGDWVLALGLALVLQNYLLALIALFISNLLGCAVYFMSTLFGHKKKLSKMPFGPLLIIGALAAYLLKDALGLILPL
ncbi:MAG: A24 family peptidase [Candidatus Nomurabacteria bacterium]|nr:A24 family peptidase [Candidatus Nomurabacteria bacterium]